LIRYYLSSGSGVLGTRDISQVRSHHYAKHPVVRMQDAWKLLGICAAAFSLCNFKSKEREVYIKFVKLLKIHVNYYIRFRNYVCRTSIIAITRECKYRISAFSVLSSNSHDKQSDCVSQSSKV
jgi:hypothetical protein